MLHVATVLLADEDIAERNSLVDRLAAELRPPPVPAMPVVVRDKKDEVHTVILK